MFYSICVVTYQVKVHALLCLSKLIDNLEPWMVTDQILPTLPKINSKEPGVLMACLGGFGGSD